VPKETGERWDAKRVSLRIHKHPGVSRLGRCGLCGGGLTIGKIGLFGKLLGCTGCIVEANKRVENRHEEDRIWFAYAQSIRTSPGRIRDLRHALESSFYGKSGSGQD
jgi:hypothetical protein